MNTLPVVTAHTGVPAARAASEDIDTVDVPERADTCLVAGADARIEHRSHSDVTEQRGELAGEVVDVDTDRHPRVRAELADAERHRLSQPSGDLAAPGPHGAGQHEHGVDAAHLGKDGDRHGPRSSPVEEGAARLQ